MEMTMPSWKISQRNASCLSIGSILGKFRFQFERMQWLKRWNWKEKNIFQRERFFSLLNHFLIHEIQFHSSPWTGVRSCEGRPVLKFFPCCRYFSDDSTAATDSPFIIVVADNRFLEVKGTGAGQWRAVDVPREITWFPQQNSRESWPFPIVVYLSDPLRVHSFFLPPLSFVLSPFLLEKVLEPSATAEIYDPCVALQEHSSSGGSSLWKQRR